MRAVAFEVGQNDFVAEGWLYESFALMGMKNYEGALKATQQYVSYGDHYAWLSQCNRLYIFIEMKQTEAIDKLMTMLEGDQLLLVLPIALECYISNGAFQDAAQYIEKYKLQVDDLLSRKDPFHEKHKLRLTHALAQYYLKSDQHELGFDYNALSLELALTFKNMQYVGMAVLIFQEYEIHASAENKSRFTHILLNEVDSNEKILITMSMALFLFGSTGVSSAANLADIGSGWFVSNIGSGWSKTSSDTESGYHVSNIGSGWSPKSNISTGSSPSNSDIGSGWSPLSSDIGTGWKVSNIGSGWSPLSSDVQINEKV